MFEKFKAQREELMAAVNDLIENGSVDEANAKMDEVKALDEKIEAAVTAKKNMEALNASAPAVDFTAKSVNVKTVAEGTVAIAEEMTAKDDAEAKYENAWARTMMGIDTAEDREVVEVYNSTLTTTTHGILIPETMAKGILDDVALAHPLYADVAKTFVKGNFTILKGTASSNAAWYDEATPIADGSETFAEVNLTGCELARSITVSWKLKAMAVSEFLPYIRAKIAEKMGQGLGYGVVSGRGKPGQSESNPWKDEPEGIITAINAESSTPQKIALVSPTDGQIVDALIAANAKIATKYSNGLAYYVSNETLWGTIATITDTTGRPIFLPDANTSGVVGRIFGRAVKVDTDVPAGSIILGNASAGYHMNFSQGVTMDSEDHKKARETDYIGYAVVDGAVVSTKAFALIAIS